MDRSSLPATSAQLSAFAREGLMYFTGHPRAYRFDAKAGQFFNDDKEPLGDAGTTLQIIPISFRIFHARLFNMSYRQWLELFFVNAAGHVCSLLLHNLSVSEFRGLAARFGYKRLRPDNVVLQIKPTARTHPESGTYYVGLFDFRVLEAEIQTVPQQLREGLGREVFRLATVTEDTKMSYQIGYPDLEQLRLAYGSSNNDTVTATLDAAAA